MRILIAEDEALIALDIEAMVTAMGYQVCGVAARGAEAVLLARETSPDLALIDVTLADGSSGLDAAAAITAELAIPIVLVTANVAALATAAIPFCPAGFVAKPYSERSLRRALDQALEIQPQPVPNG
ncbi:response regulator [Arenibaculum pallidiluteum]|uniref:response regulator n=1 Tax=Arenibaculum pallidiluteum TaxID=2812559 RepID=UPI001A975B12|nr:response regulator [Arenibaculum pallidiluteum]